MTAAVAAWPRPAADPPLDPSGSEARAKLRRELLHPEYHQQNLLQRAPRLADAQGRAAGSTPPRRRRRSRRSWRCCLRRAGARAGLAGLPRPAHRPRASDEKRRGPDRRRSSPPTSCGPGPRRRSRRAGSRRRWSRGSARSRSARSSAAGWPTPRAPPPTRWPRRSRAEYAAMARPGARGARGSSTRCCTATGRPPASRPLGARPRRRPGGAPMTTTARRARGAGRSRVRPPAPLDAADRPGPGRRGRRGHRARHRHARPRRPMDPDNPGPDGAQALARVLGDEGVDVAGGPRRRRARGDRRRRRHVGGRRARRSTSAPAPSTGCATTPPARRTVVVVGAGPGVGRRARASPGGGASIPLGDGPRRPAATTPASTGSPWRSTSTTVYPERRLLRRQGRRDRHRAGRRAAALRRRPGAHQRPDPAGRQRRGRAAAARPGRRGWSGTSRASTTSPATTASASSPAARAGSGPALALLAVAMVAVILWRGRRLGAARHRAAAGRGPRGRDHAQPGPALPPLRRPRPRRRVAARAAARAGSPSGCGSAPRPRPDVAGPRGGRGAPAAPRTTSCALLGPRRRRTVHRPRPDHPGQRAGRARQRGTPHMTDAPPGPDRPTRRRPRAARRGARRGRQGRGRAGRRRLRPARRAALRRPRADGGRARHRQDAAGAHAGAALSVDTRRVQFTPDLMPGDITGSMVIDSRQAGELTFREGPVFTNLLLADEINRTPPKTQSALLEAMEEGQVSVDGVSPPAARAVPGRRHPEPGRVRRHLPAARGAARPVPAQGGAADPRARRGARDPAPARRRLRPARRRGGRRTAVAGPADIAAGQAAVATRAGRPRGGRLHRRHRPGHPRVAVAEPRRQPARRHRAAARRPGPGRG